MHESILAGSLSLIGLHDERGQYLGARQLKLRIFPGSGLAGKTPKWIVAGEVAETSRVYARNVAAVEPGWIEQQAQHLLKHQSSEPFWSISRGEVMGLRYHKLIWVAVGRSSAIQLELDRSGVLSRFIFARSDGCGTGEASARVSCA